ncbi:MAG: AAA family ATPase [Sandaracinaceae bacterium]|nr:AAA family ATPase [Sandaracinaceae bacterium]
MRAAHAGVGRLCLITGEPGVGKSRLLEELAQAAAADTVTLWGRCSEAGGAPAFWPWVQVVRALARRADAASILARPGRAAHLAALLPELGAGDAPRPVDPERARFALLDAVVATLAEAAEATPVLVLLEDLHAADPDSIALLEVLAGAVRGARVAVVGSMREARARRSSVAAALARLAREARTLFLARLERGEVEDYLAGALGGAPDPRLVEDVVRATEGNALFLAQIAPRLAHGDAIVIPHGVREAIRERLDELSGGTRAVLEAAAVLGREIALAELEALAEGSQRAIDEALSAEIVIEAPPRPCASRTCCSSRSWCARRATTASAICTAARGWPSRPRGARRLAWPTTTWRQGSASAPCTRSCARAKTRGAATPTRTPPSRSRGPSS